MNKDLDDLWDIAWFNDINGGEKSEMLYSHIEDFCNKWKDYTKIENYEKAIADTTLC